MPQVPFEFVFESERPSGNSVTKLLTNCHYAIQTQTQTEAEGYRMHAFLPFSVVQFYLMESECRLCP